MQTLEYKVYDLNFQIRGPLTAAIDDLALVTLDQRTADSLSFPFDRRHYATLIRKLNLLGARLIVFDIDFSSLSPLPASDSLFQEAIRRGGNVVLAGKHNYQYHSGIAEPIVDLTCPSPSIAPPGTPFGLVNDLFDPDGVMRRYPLFLTLNDSTYPSLGLRALTVDNHKSWDPKPPPASGDLPFDSLVIPRFEYNAVLLNFYGPAGTIPTYSFIDVISGEYDFGDLLEGLSDEEIEALKESGALELLSESPFKDRIVLVGASAEDMQDNKFTPFYSARNTRKTPGVEVHAHAIKMIRDGIFIRAVGFWWTLLGTLLFSLLMYLGVRFLKHWLSLAGAGLFIAGILAAGVWLFVKQGLCLQEIPLILSVGLGYPVNLMYRIILAQREKTMIRGMFSHYLPQKYVDTLIQNPDMLQLGGKRRRMSVLFSDVAGFTTVSEKLSPEELIALLNEYLTALTRVILENDGIIDKYEGDLIMAEFGMPVWYEDHAAKCCLASLRMQKKLAELRLKWRSEGRSELYSRVGANTGDMVFGNMGSDEVFDYTVMGDTVNLASRLEGANKAYGTTIMIGKPTYEDVKDKFVCRHLDSIQVKGKLEGVEVYELLAESPDELTSGKLKAIELYGEGLTLYRERNFESAYDKFQQALVAEPTDSPSKVFLGRCETYIKEPPPEDWKGVWTLTEK